MPNPENLKPWKPGQSGNPKGSTQGRRVSAALAKLLEDKNLDETVAVTIFAAAIGDPKLLKGRKPDARFMQMLLDRVEGKVTDKLSIETRQAEDDSAFDALAGEVYGDGDGDRDDDTEGEGPG